MHGAIRHSLLLLLLASMPPLFAQQAAPAPQQKSATPPTAAAKKKSAPKLGDDQPSIDPREIQLLKQSYAAGAGLDSVARIHLLIEQCTAAEDIEELGPTWCTELFQAARDQLSAGDLRAHAQNTAARSLSLRNPDTALAMLQEIDTTDAQGDERASTARMVFDGVLRSKGLKAFPELMATAARLGDSGAYPYFATTMLMYGGTKPHNFRDASNQKYSESQMDLCNQVLLQGDNYFKKSSMDVKSSFQFLTLLRVGATSGCPSAWMTHQAATDFANELVKLGTAAINGEENPKPTAMKTLYDSSQRLLHEIDPVLAESVDKKIGGVRNLTTPISSAPAKPTVLPWQSNPEALALYQQIDISATALNNAPDGTRPHTVEMESAIREGLTAALKLTQKVEEIDPDAAANLRRAGGNVPSLMDAAMRIWPDLTIQQIQSMPDGEFKANLLLEASKGIRNQSEQDRRMRMKLR